MYLRWDLDEVPYRSQTHNRIYQIIEHGALWRLRVRDREEPIDVPLEDLWQTLGFYRNPTIAMIHADCHEEKVA